MGYPTIRTHPHIAYADEPLTFQVERDHCRGSVVGDPEQCAGARALDSMPEVKQAWVKRTITTIEFLDGRILRYRNPKRLQNGIEGFDATAGFFPPGEYKLNPVCHSQRSDPRLELTPEERAARRAAKAAAPAGDPDSPMRRKRPAHVLR